MAAALASHPHQPGGPQLGNRETELDKDGWAVTGSQQAPCLRFTILGCSSYS